MFQDLAKRLVARAGKAKPTSISSFLFHLYHSQDILREEEDTDYRAAQELTNYKITHDPEPESNPFSGEKGETGNASAPNKPSREGPLQGLNQPKQMKHTYRAP